MGFLSTLRIASISVSVRNLICVLDSGLLWNRDVTMGSGGLRASAASAGMQSPQNPTMYGSVSSKDSAQEFVHGQHHAH
jgi:hypothetical protein